MPVTASPDQISTVVADLDALMADLRANVKTLTGILTGHLDDGSM